MHERRRDILEEMMNFIEMALAQAFQQMGVHYIPRQPHAETSEDEPYIDIIESETEYILTTELPGIRTEDISLSATEHDVQLSINASEGNTSRYCRLVKTIGLTDEIIPDKIKAKYKNGVLGVHAPKKHQKNKVKINVE